MRMYDIIKTKRDGGALTKEQIDFAVTGFTGGGIGEGQMAALAMAIWFNGMSERETAELTLAMARSGDSVDLSRFGTKTVDKHSTGGVGDKTSLVIMPIAASCGAVCAKMSGRGLGHTGGTADKLESIPGYKTELSTARFLEQAEKVGLVLATQSGNLTPADKKLYALRDMTATVDSLPLIASSIMSKKIASGAHSIVLDVKAGGGAFMKTADDARALARVMVDIGTRLGRKVRAVVTDMDTPLGTAVGNALEVREAVELLRGRGADDLKEVCFVLAENMLELSLGMGKDEAEKAVRDSVSSGRAYKKLCEWIAAQGGDLRCIDDVSLLPRAARVLEVKAEKSGFITAMDAEKIGRCAMSLGAGRLEKDMPIDFAAGIEMLKKTGEYISAGEPVARLYTNKNDAGNAEKLYLSALETADTPPEKRKIVIDIIE